MTVTITTEQPATGPKPTVTIAGPEMTAADLDHQRRANRPPVVHTEYRPEMVSVRPPDTPGAEEAKRHAARRPADKSARAVQAALDVVVADLASAKAAVLHRQDRAVEILITGTPADVKTARDALEMGQIEVEQLNLMQAGLRVSLDRAKQVEAEDEAAFVASLPAARARLAAYTKFIERDYPALAAKIAAGLALEADAEKAHARLTTAANTLDGHDHPAPLPRAMNGLQPESYGYRASLPGTDLRPKAPWAIRY